MLNRKQKLSVLLITLGTLILAATPICIRNLFFIVDNVSTNDVSAFIIFPTLMMLLLLFLPFLAARITPVLSSFDVTWTQKPRTKIRGYFMLVLSPVVLGIIVGLISKHIGYPTMKFFKYNDVTKLTLTFFVLQVLFSTIFIPIVEEIFWRGYIQDQFSKCFGSIISAFLQAFLFAFAHGRPLLGFIHIFLVGIIFGFWRLKRRSLVPIIIAHVIMNALWCIGHYPDQYEMSKKNIEVNYVDEINNIGNTFPSKDNADIDYQKALDLYNRPSKILYGTKIIRKNLWPDELTAEQRQSLEQWLTQNNAAFVQFRQGTKKTSYWPHYDGDMIFEADNFVEMANLKELACALIWNAKIHVNNGDIQQAIDDLVSACRFGNHFSSGPKPMSSFLIGMGIKGNVCDTLFLMIDKTEMDADQLESLQKHLQQEYQNNPSTLDFTWEKFTLYDIIQSIFTDDGNGDGHIPRAEQKGQDVKMLKFLTPNLSDEQIEAWNQSDRKTTTELVDELFDFINGAFLKTPTQLKNENIDIRSKIDELMLENVLYPHVSSITAIHQIFHINRAAQDALIATLAVLRYEKVNNTLPENLEVLVSEGYLSRIPIDPFSNQPLIYKKNNGSFLLYSVGQDFDDDGGLHDDNWGRTDGDYVFWPVQYVNPQ